jgi:hypothetical protein
MTHTILITGLTVRDAPETPKGERLLAYFEFTVAGLKFVGCQLRRTAKGGFTVALPRIEGPLAERRCVTFEEESLRHAVMQAARAVYLQFGGKFGEWQSRFAQA